MTQLDWRTASADEAARLIQVQPNAINAAMAEVTGHSDYVLRFHPAGQQVRAEHEGFRLRMNGMDAGAKLLLLYEMRDHFAARRVEIETAEAAEQKADRDRADAARREPLLAAHRDAWNRQHTDDLRATLKILSSHVAAADAALYRAQDHAAIVAVIDDLAPVLKAATTGSLAELRRVHKTQITKPAEEAAR